MIEKLPPRERQVFDALYACGEATVAELCATMVDPPSGSAARIMLSRMERKGFVKHRIDKGKYVYAPALSEPAIKQSAVKQFLDTFFRGSPIGAAAALIGMSGKVDVAELEALEAAVARIREEKGK